MTGQVRALELSEAMPGRGGLRAQPDLNDRHPSDRQCRRLAGERWSPPAKGRKRHDTCNEEAELRAVRSGQRARDHGVGGDCQRRGAARQVVQGRPHPLLRRRRRGRRFRHRSSTTAPCRRRTTPARRSTTSSPAGRSEKMVQQLREAVAAKPDGIAMMGHPGDAVDHAARRAGVQGRHQDDVPERAGADGRRGKFGGGYVGAQQGPQGTRARRGSGPPLRPQGRRHGDRVRPVRQNPNRAVREARHGRRARRRPASRSVAFTSPPEWAADPNLAIPVDHRGADPEQSGRQGDRLSGRPAARQRCRPTCRRPARSRARSSTSASTPARRSSRLQGRLGAAHRRPAAVPAGLPADPQPLPAGRLRPRADERRHRRRLRHARELRGRRGLATEGLR